MLEMKHLKARESLLNKIRNKLKIEKRKKKKKKRNRVNKHECIILVLWPTVRESQHYYLSISSAPTTVVFSVSFSPTLL
jgi:hypothetical protein